MAFKVSANVHVNVVTPKGVRGKIDKALNIKKPFDVSLNVDPRHSAKITALTSKLKAMQKAATGARKGVSGFGGAGLTGIVSVGLAVSKVNQVFKAGVVHVAKWGDQLKDIEVITGQTQANLQPLSKTVSNLSRSFGTADLSLLEASQTLLQSGISLSDTQQSLANLAKANLDPTFDNLNSIVESQIVLQKVFKLSVDETGKALGAISALSAKYAVSSSDLASALQRAGGAFEIAGGSVNELLGAFTIARQESRLSADSIATALNTITLRLQRKSSESFLNTMNVSLRDADGKLLPIARQLQVVSKAFNDLEEGDPKRFEIIEKLFGVRQASKAIPILKSFQSVQEAINVAQESGNRLNEVAEIQQGKVSTQLTKVSNNFHELSRLVAEGFGGDAMDGFLGKTNEVLDSTIKLSDAFAPLGDALRFLWDISPISLYIKAIDSVADKLSGLINSNDTLREFVAGSATDGSVKSGNSLSGVAGSGSVPIKRNGPQNVLPKNARQAFFNPGQDVIPNETGKQVSGIFAQIKERINDQKSFQLLGDKFGPLDKLPGIIERVNNTGLEGAELDEVIQNELKGFPQAIRDSIDSVKDLNQLSSLTSKLVSVMEKDLSTLQKNLDKRNNLASVGTGLKVGLSNTVAQRDNTNNFRERLAIVTGQSNTSAKGLGNELRQRNANIAGIESQLDTVPASKKAELLKALDSEKTARAKAIKGLELFANVTERLNKLENDKLSREKQKQALIAGFVESTGQLKGRDLRDRKRSIADASRLATTGNLSDVKGSRRTNAIDIFKKFSNVKLTEFGNKTGRDILTLLESNEARKGKSVNFTIPKIDTNPTRKSIFKDSIDAQQGLIRGNTQEQNLVTQPNINFDGLNSAATTFQSSAQMMNTVIENHSKVVKDMATAIPSKVTMTFTGTVNHIFNGAEVFKAIQPAFEDYANKKIEQSINKLIKDKMPSTGANFEINPQQPKETK